MAQIVFKATDNVHADPVIDARGCYKYGDPVDIFASDRSLGRSVCFPTFMIVDCPEMENPEYMKYLLQGLTEQTSEVDGEGHPTSPDTIRRKRYGYNLHLLPSEYKNQLFGTGYVEMPFYILEGVKYFKE